jgi:hypothetical protein
MKVLEEMLLGGFYTEAAQRPGVPVAGLLPFLTLIYPFHVFPSLHHCKCSA